MRSEQNTWHKVFCFHVLERMFLDSRSPLNPGFSVIWLLLLPITTGSFGFNTILRFSRIRPNSQLMLSQENEFKFWNREESKRRDLDEAAPVIKQAMIISLCDRLDVANNPVTDSRKFPVGAELLATGESIKDFDIEALCEKRANVIFVSHPKAKEPLAYLLEKIPTIEWVHCRSAGIDFVASPTFNAWKGVVTNAKGHFSSTLAEYTLMACSYFAKDLPRLLGNKKSKKWDKYSILELRGATLGIIGYGDIGRACARLAAAYGMRVIAMRKTAVPDPLCEAVYEASRDTINSIFSQADYVLCSLPLTDETQNMIGQEQFEHAKEGCVFINVGRGPVVNEGALIRSLINGRLKGAGLDVFATEPLPADSLLWELDNVLLSPHNMDKTATFMLEASCFFVDENLPRFLRGFPLLNRVDPAKGY